MNEEANVEETALDSLLRRRRETRDELAGYKSLEENTAFQELMGVFSNNVDMLRNKMELREPEGLNGAINAECERGEIKATRTMISYIPMQVESLMSALEVYDEAIAVETASVQEEEKVDPNG